MFGSSKGEIFSKIVIMQSNYRRYFMVLTVIRVWDQTILKRYNSKSHLDLRSFKIKYEIFILKHWAKSFL